VKSSGIMQVGMQEGYSQGNYSGGGSWVHETHLGLGMVLPVLKRPKTGNRNDDHIDISLSCGLH
jgi:hypothetical protein